MSSTPILDNKDPSAPSVFEPTALLREARRQKGLPIVEVPALCVLDPDGDIVRRLRHSGQAKPSATWPCYHTELYEFALAGKTAGIIGCAVGAPFAVLVAEELFACGCRILISLTSAGQIVPAGELPYFVVIDRALRDEGTSYHYAPPHIFAEADSRIVAAAVRAVTNAGLRAYAGRAGQPTRRSAKRSPLWRRHAPRVSWPSRWRPLRFTHSRANGTKPFFAWGM